MNQDPSDNFDNPKPRGPWTRWMFWLFIIVGLFVVCLLIWMFVAMSDNDIDRQIENEAIEMNDSTINAPVMDNNAADDSNYVNIGAEDTK